MIDCAGFGRLGREGFVAVTQSYAKNRQDSQRCLVILGGGGG
jgi:hypothetical protein